MTNDEKKQAYEALCNIEKQMEDLHNTLNYWVNILLNEIDWEDENELV